MAGYNGKYTETVSRCAKSKVQLCLCMCVFRSTTGELCN